MKYLFLATSLLLSPAPATRVFAQLPTERLIEIPRPFEPDEPGPLHGPRHIDLGMTPADVINAMNGRPDEKLAPDLWVYWGFRTGGSPAVRKFDTLVIHFSAGRVGKYQLVEQKALKALMTGLRTAANPKPAVAAQ